MLRLAFLVLALGLPPLPTLGPPPTLLSPLPAEVGGAWTYMLEFDENGGEATLYVPLACRPCSAAAYLTAGASGGYAFSQTGVSAYSVAVTTPAAGFAVEVLETEPGAVEEDLVGFRVVSTAHAYAFVILLTSYKATPVVQLEDAWVLHADEGQAKWWNLAGLSAVHARAVAAGAGAGGRYAWTSAEGSVGALLPPSLEPVLGAYVVTPAGSRVCAGVFLVHTCGTPFFYGGPGAYEIGLGARNDLTWERAIAVTADVDAFGYASPVPHPLLDRLLP